MDYFIVQGMVGKGWTWLGSDGAISTMFKTSQNLQRAMQGMVGFRPQTGSGDLFESVHEEWQRIDLQKADRTVSSFYISCMEMLGYPNESNIF